MANRKEQTSIPINKPLRDKLREWKESGDNWDTIIIELMEFYEKNNKPQSI